MTTMKQEQLYDNEAEILNTARGQLKAFIDKLSGVVEDGVQALTSMDARLEHFDAGSRRVEPTTTDKKKRA